MSYSFVLIGYPITHSLSPWIHKQFFQRTNLIGTYGLEEIAPEDNFSDRMQHLKNKNVDGFNVTVPYKEKVIEYHDELDGQAQQIGAVNTVVQRNGKWIGYNTDGIGYVRALESDYPEIKERKSLPILLIGAGGAAKGIYYGLKEAGYTNVTIANRTVERAEQIVNDHNAVISLRDAEENLANYSVVIQTTSVGMRPNIDEVVISLENIKKDAIVSDIVYQPLKTKFLQEAETRGANIHFGHTMLLYQAQYAFELWTNSRPMMDGLKEQLQQQLEG